MQVLQFEFIAALLGLFALFFFYGAYKILVRTSWFWGWLVGNFGIALLLLTGLLAILVVDVRSYHPMFDGSVIGSMSVHTLSSGHHQLRLVNNKGFEEAYTFDGNNYQLVINEFQWDTRFSGMGMGHGYRIRGIQSKFSPNETAHFVSVENSLYVDAWALVKRFLPDGYIVTAHEVITESLPVVDGGMYELVPDAYDVLLNPLNQIAKDAKYNKNEKYNEADLLSDVSLSEEGTPAVDGGPISNEMMMGGGESGTQEASGVQAAIEIPETNEATSKPGIESESTETKKPETEMLEERQPESPLVQSSNSGKIIRTVPGAHLQATPAELIRTVPAGEN